MTTLRKDILGKWKCWWSDVQEVFTIDCKNGQYTVDVDGKPAVNVQLNHDVLTFHTLKSYGGHESYNIDWSLKEPRMDLEDVDANGEVYNTEWGYVVPFNECFKPH
eukprot:gene7339-11658_t